MIKTYLFSLCFVFILVSCDGVKNNFGFSEVKPTIDTVLYSMPTKVIFHDTMIELGDIKEGTVKELVFHYQNIGDKPLMLFNVSPGCGCTIADFSHRPLMPGMSDSIVAKFDSKEKEGRYQKNIKVNCNTEEKVYNLAFSVNVIK
jgi:hypothetical protein